MDLCKDCKVYRHSHGRRNLTGRSRSWSPHCRPCCNYESSQEFSVSEISDTTENMNRELDQGARNTDDCLQRRKINESRSCHAPEIVLFNNEDYQIVARKSRVIKEKTSETSSSKYPRQKWIQQQPSSRWGWLCNSLYSPGKNDAARDKPYQEQKPCTTLKPSTELNYRKDDCKVQKKSEFSAPVNSRGWFSNLLYRPNCNNAISEEPKRSHDHKPSPDNKPCTNPNRSNDDYLKRCGSENGIPIKIGNMEKIVDPNDRFRVKLLLYSGDCSKHKRMGGGHYCSSCLTKNKHVCNMENKQRHNTELDTDCETDPKETNKDTDKTKKEKKNKKEPKEKKDKKGKKEKKEKDKNKKKDKDKNEKDSKKDKQKTKKNKSKEENTKEKEKEKDTKESKENKDKKKKKEPKGKEDNTDVEETNERMEDEEGGASHKKSKGKKDKENDKKKDAKSRKEKITTREETVIKDGETHITKDTTAEISDKAKSSGQGNKETKEHEKEHEKVLSMYRLRTTDRNGKEIDIILNRNNAPNLTKIDEGILFKNLKEIAPPSLGEQIIIKHKLTHSKRGSLWERQLSSDNTIKFKNIREIAPQNFKNIIKPERVRRRSPEKHQHKHNSSTEIERRPKITTSDVAGENDNSMEATKKRKNIMLFIQNKKRKLLEICNLSSSGDNDTTETDQRVKHETKPVNREPPKRIVEEHKTRESASILLVPTKKQQNTQTRQTSLLNENDVETEKSPSISKSIVSNVAQNEFRRVLNKIIQGKENDKKCSNDSNNEQRCGINKRFVSDDTTRIQFRNILKQVTQRKRKEDPVDNEQTGGKLTIVKEMEDELSDAKGGSCNIEIVRESTEQPSNPINENRLHEELNELSETLQKES